MIKNISSSDRITRIILSLSLFTLAYFQFNHTITGIVLVALGVIFIGTALLNFCPIYKIFGISSFKKKSDES